jgi:hypothetical protein
MSKTISKLNVGIGGSFGGLAKTFNGAAAATQSFVGKLSAMGGGIAKLGAIGAAIAAPIAGFMALNKVVGQIGGAFESIDVVGKLADRLGFTTEQLTGLHHAANLAGISSEQLTGALEYMTKSLGKMSEDGGAAAASLAEIGLNADSLAAMAPDAAMKLIADKMAAIENPAARAAAVVKIFGKSGQALLPLLSEGAAGIAKAQAEAAKLGLTFSRVDAKRVEEANDAITRLKAVFTGMAQKIAIGIAPIVELVAVKLQGLSLWISEWGAGIYNYFAANWQGIADTTGGAIAAVYEVFRSGFVAVSEITSSVWAAVSSVWAGGANGILEMSNKTGNALGEDNLDVVKSFGELAAKVKEVFANLAVYIENWQSALQVVWAKLKVGYSSYLKAMWDAGQSFAQHPQSNAALDKNVTDAVAAYDKAKNEFDQRAAESVGKQYQRRDKIANFVGNTFKNIFQAVPLKLPTFAPPTIPNPPPIVPTLSTDNLTLGINVEIKKAKAIAVGSAESQLLRYAPALARAAGVSTGASPHSDGMSLFGGAAKPGSPSARPAASPSTGQAEFWAALNAEAKLQTDYLRKIETNTRTLQLATGVI